MPEYPITWMDYRLPTGREFSVAICGNDGKICHMSLGGDVDRRSSLSKVSIERQDCSRSRHCVALDCPLNKTPKEQLIHMLGMHEDEVLDKETAKLWGTESMVEGLVKFIKKVESILIWGNTESK